MVHERRQGLSGRIENRQCRGRGLSAEFVHVMQRRASRVEREHYALVVIPSNRACSVVIRRKFSSGHHGAFSRRNGQPPGRRKMAKCARLFYKPRTPIRTERRTCSRFIYFLDEKICLREERCEWPLCGLFSISMLPKKGYVTLRARIWTKRVLMVREQRGITKKNRNCGIDSKWECGQ